MSVAVLTTLALSPGSVVDGKVELKISVKVISALFVSSAFFLVLGNSLFQGHYQLLGSPSDNQFVYLSDAFLHHRLNLVGVPSELDLCYFQGKLYAYWPPLAAVLLMPIVQVTGVEIGHRWVSILFAAVSTYVAFFIVDRVAGRYSLPLNNWTKMLWSAGFAFGTSNLILGHIGNTWFFAQICSSMTLMAAILCILSRHEKWWHFLIAGIFWGLSILGRVHLILAFPFFLYFAFYPENSTQSGLASAGASSVPNIRGSLVRTLWLMLPLALVLSLFAWYNYARFGSPLDLGLTYHNMDERFRYDYFTYGYWNPRYVWRNIYYELLRLPLFQNNWVFQEPGPMTSWTEGYSLFYQSPFLLFAFASLRSKMRDRLVVCTWAAAILISLAILMILGSGWMQFGARYMFDVVPFLFVLSVIGSGGRARILLLTLVVTAAVINFSGLRLLQDEFIRSYWQKHGHKSLR